MKTKEFEKLIEIYKKIAKVKKPTYVRQDNGDDASLILEWKIENDKNN